MLAVRSLNAGYGGTQVLFEANLEVHRGEIVALLGTNGAGKSTLLRCIGGSLEPWSGDIELNGERINGLSANQVSRRSVAVMPGGKATFTGLDVAEHFRLASWALSRTEGRRRSAEALEIFPRLRERWSEKAGNLSGGEQQQLGLAQALVAQPGLLLIDELSLGLAPVIVERLMSVVRGLNDQGVTVVLVEQSVNIALELADRAVFMEKGQVRFDGLTRDLVVRDDLLRSVFLGADEPPSAADSLAPSAWAEEGAPVLRASGVCCTFGGIKAVDRVDVSVAAGEIVSVVGPNGAGKTTLLDLLSGQTPLAAGRIELAGRDITTLRPELRARAGMGRSFQDARLFPALSVAQTLAVALDRHLTEGGPLSVALCRPHIRRQERWIHLRVNDLLALLGLQDFADKLVSDLSTGSRRVVDLGCCLAHEPLVLLLDEPASGLAQREVEALPALLRRIRDETGAGLLVVEHDMPLVRSLSDKVIVMAEGTVLAEGAPAEALGRADVVAAYLGHGVAAQRSGSGVLT